MIEDKNKIQTQQNLIMENRQKLNISGIEDVINFDDQTVCVNTNLGMITIKGYNLKMNKLNLDNTELMIDGEIVSIVYSENYSKSGFFHKIFK